MKPTKCYFRIFTAAQLRDIERSKSDVANSGLAHDPRFDPPPKIVRFMTFEVPQVGDELETTIEGEEVRVRVQTRAFIFLSAEADPENVSIRFDVATF